MKRGILILLCLLPFQWIYSQNTVRSIFERLQWEELAPLTPDRSHLAIADHFDGCSTLKITGVHRNGMGYIARFTEHGEVGTVSFVRTGSVYASFKVHVQLTGIDFINRLRVYSIHDKTIRVGDAEIHFHRGRLYRTEPMDSLLLFSGEWTFRIFPDDHEEQLTLKRKYNTDFFQNENSTGLFFIKNPDFLSDVTGKTVSPGESQETPALLQWAREQFGIYMDQIGEHWFIPLPQETQLITFPKGNKGFFFYIYNPGQDPDSRLFMNTKIPGPTEIILNYNREKRPKIQFGEPNRASDIRLDLNVDPRELTASGEATISYKNPSTIKILNLNPGMKISSIVKKNQKDSHFIYQRNNQFYILGPEESSITLTFNGKIQSSDTPFEIFRPTTTDTIRPIQKSSYLFLDRYQHFYPNPGIFHSSFHVRVSCPPSLTCLASADPVQNENTIPSVYEFRSPASRGFSLVMGKFKRQKIFDGTPPLYIYTHEPMEMPGKINFDEIRGALKFFSQTFGSLEIQRLNILLKSGRAEGGISQRGLIIMTLPRNIRKVSTLFLNESQTYRSNKNIRSPVILRDIPEDYMIHEIAHQWWGGMLSPKDYQDIWINEGLAQLSLVLYLKKIQKPKKFSRMIRVMRRWVLAHNAVGPVIYGKRILSLTRDFRFYQSIVYNKPAFVFLMLMEMIGEESFFQRLRDVTAEYKYKTVNTRQFINRFSRGDNTIKDFLSRWIYHRAIPKIRLVLAKDDPEYDRKHRKRIVLMIKQENTDFIFPLRLRIDARGGREFKDIIISRKNQRVVITRETPIHTIETIPHFSLFKEVMVTPVERKKFKF